MVDRPRAPMTADVVRLEVGQRVWIYDVNANHSSRPNTTWPLEGTVVKVGRKLAHITHSYSRGFPQVFRLDEGQRANDNYGHQWFRTDEQRAAYDARKADEKVLRDHGIEKRVGVTLTDEQVAELAAVVRAWDTDKADA